MAESKNGRQIAARLQFI